MCLILVWNNYNASQISMLSLKNDLKRVEIAAKSSKFCILASQTMLSLKDGLKCVEVDTESSELFLMP